MRQSSLVTGRLAGVAAAVLFLLTLGSPASADDRDLLRDSVGEPYVFILLDTSGSMHWTPTCTPAQIAARSCSIPCPEGDCYAPMQGDDPNSKFFQAKSALYEVLRDTDDIHFGFGTYNQDGLHLRSKHWLYRATSDGPVIPGWGPFPAQGSQDVFGRTWTCDNGNGDEEVGCRNTVPADLADEWERSRMQRFAKGGLTFSTAVTTFVRHDGQTYRVIYEPRSGSYGSNLTVRVLIERCRNGSCSSRETTGDLDVTFESLGDFATWDSAAARAERQRGFFDQGEAADPLTGNTCSGWDSNTDTTSDRHSGYSTRWPTNASDLRGAAFTVGDVIPLDWQADHKNDILRRLAPNLALDPTATPDFRTAAYFRDARSGAEDFLRLKNEAARPFVASGATPLGNSVDAFRTWWAGCPQGSCPKNSGWKDIAAANDPDWGCRRKFLLILTDGDDTCPGADACSSTASLFAQESVKTYVVAFGVEDDKGGNKLTCMAANGGSGKPIYPQNKADLVKALKDIFGQIREEASAFASAAVPSVQAEVADRIYLSSFTPLNSQSVWDGHLDAYLKPLPLTADRRPDRNRACPAPGSPNRGSCHLWDAGEVLVGQAPAAADLAGAVNESTLRLGLQTNERRVFYGMSGFSGMVPRTLRLFSPPAGDPATDPQWTDLWTGLGIGFSDRNAAASRTRNVIARTLQIKESVVDLVGGGTRPIRYVLGDIFHSDPAVLDRPNDFGFFSSNLESRGEACSTDPGYRCFALENARRRKMLVVGSNDGQLHFFDAGVWDSTRGQFGDGTGAEIFSFIPRPALTLVRELAEGTKQIFGLDSTPRLDDVFLDPRHNGTPDPDQREWRTLLVGGFREGGSKDGGTRMIDFVSGYYALDITQPDQLEVDGDPIDRRVVPSCLATDNQPVPGCGPLPFPALLWEFTDSIAGAQLDEDDVNGDGVAEGNGYPDLGQTWSAPTIGRIRVREGTDIVAKFVAIFGGGMDAESKASPRRGNWLYMIDVETGKPIYKQQLAGATPADPAALDIDLDGFLDVVYAGTTAGFMYKVDLRSIPDLETLTLRKELAVPDLVVNQEVTRIVDPRWEPFPIFSTFGRPIYFAPTLFYVSKAQRFALAFGTGDREDLWSFNDQEGRFYVILDDNFTADMLSIGDLPKDETQYPAIQPNGLNALAGTDYVLAPSAGQERGWYMRLDPDERVITQAFGLSGVIIFSGFQPQVTIDPGPGNGNGGNKKDGPVCARGGTSRIFVVLANNGNSLLSTGGVPTRFRTVPEFVTNPYVEQGSTKNPDGSNGPNSEILDQTQKAILGELKKFYPPGTKFANYWISVSGIRSDTGYERYATIPVGIIERNWKEH